MSDGLNAQFNADADAFNDAVKELPSIGRKPLPEIPCLEPGRADFTRLVFVDQRDLNNAVGAIVFTVVATGILGVATCAGLFYLLK